MYYMSINRVHQAIQDRFIHYWIWFEEADFKNFYPDSYIFLKELFKMKNKKYSRN